MITAQEQLSGAMARGITRGSAKGNGGQRLATPEPHMLDYRSTRYHNAMRQGSVGARQGGHARGFSWGRRQGERGGNVWERPFHRSWSSIDTNRSPEIKLLWGRTALQASYTATHADADEDMSTLPVQTECLPPTASAVFLIVLQFCVRVLCCVAPAKADAGAIIVNG